MMNRTGQVLVGMVAFLALVVSGCNKPKLPNAPVDPAALARAEDEFQKSPDDREARVGLVRLLLQQGDQLERHQQPEKAVPIYRRVILIEPGNAYAHYALGRALVSLGKAWDALPVLEGQMRKNPHVSADFYHQLALSLMALGRFDKASESLMKSLSIQPFQADTYKSLLDLSRRRSKQTPAEREAARTAGVEKYGLPDRGWHDKTVEEWQEIAAAAGPGAAPAGAGAAGHTPGQGPGRGRKAIALYNLAQYQDAAVDPKKALSYDEAIKAGQKYVQFAGDMVEESPFTALVEQRLTALVAARKEIWAALGVTPLDPVLARSRQSLEQMQNGAAGLPKIKAAAEAAGDQDAAARAQALLDQLVAANLVSLQDRLRNVNHQVQALIERAQARDPAVTADFIAAEAARLDAEVQAVEQEAKGSGVTAALAEADGMRKQFNVTVMHGGGEGHH